MIILGRSCNNKGIRFSNREIFFIFFTVWVLWWHIIIIFDILTVWIRHVIVILHIGIFFLFFRFFSTSTLFFIDHLSEFRSEDWSIIWSIIIVITHVHVVHIVLNFFSCLSDISLMDILPLEKFLRHFLMFSNFFFIWLIFLKLCFSISSLDPA